MGNYYQQISIFERCEITRLPTAGLSKPEIAAPLNLASSTIPQELNRNASANGDQHPEYTQQPAQVSDCLALNYRTPAAVFAAALHLKCESTFRLAPE